MWANQDFEKRFAFASGVILFFKCLGEYCFFINYQSMLLVVSLYKEIFSASSYCK